MASEADVLEAVKAGDADRVQHLLDEQPTLGSARDSNGISVLLHAHYRAREDLVDIIRRARPYLDLFEAAALGDGATVSRMVALGGDSVDRVSPDGYTPLHLAAHFGHARVAKLLIDEGAPLDAVSQNELRVTPLHSALAGSRLDVAALLIERGADVNASQRDGWTPLHYAAHNGDIATVGLLLAHGADPDARTKDGARPQAVAERSGHNDAVAALLG
jgi:ankyrin repeat protein